ncbi:sigma-70 family RNA polymerase sigma factor [Streptomyces sp. RFCAC02]|uniref:RNA polymerase sigma factor n=1 Tax=Streptomyces sp. RFCAC02 TaxID=2499143 RepID=UPI00102057BA|nr:sigma-70 family RNA polymerase sigma factor [Streptomyces sp. RFCAC02]
MESDEQAEYLDRLFRSTFHRVMAYCLRRAPGPVAEDAVAEVYAVAWQRRRDLPGDERDAVPWLLGVARKVLANQRRGRHRWARLLRRAGDLAVPPPAGGEGPDISAALATLSATDREALRLAYWDGLSHREIGVVLGISEGAATTRLHRARTRLRARIVRNRPAHPAKPEGTPHAR